jgi:hypothetical protein
MKINIKGFFSKALTTVATVAAICFTSSSVVYAAGSASPQESAQESTLPIQSEQAPITTPSVRINPVTVNQNSIIQPLSSQGYSQAYNQSYSQSYSSPSTYNSSSSCGAQVTGKTGNNPYGQLEWGIGFTINLNNPCVTQPIVKQETLSCHQQRLRGMEMLLNYHNQNKDPKNQYKLPSVDELNKYLNTLCVVS